MWKLLLFHTKMISAQFFWGSVLLGEEQQIDAKNQIWNFESTLYEIWEYAFKWRLHI